MFKPLSLLLAPLLSCLFTVAQPTNPVSLPSGTLPSAYSPAGKAVFIENKGQLADNSGKVLTDVLYHLRLPGMEVYFRKTGLSFVLLENVNPDKSTFSASTNPLIDPTNLSALPFQAYRLDLVWENSRAGMEVLASMPAKQTYNYYYGHCPNGVTNVQSFEKLTYRNVYEGIDLEFYTKKIDGILRLKYDIVVHPGADPTLIQLKYLTDNLPANIGLNEVIFNTPLGNFREQLGQIYQTIENKTVPIEGNYKIDNGVINFDISHYDPTQKLIIDPFFTYYGGTADDQGEGIDTDGNNNVVVVGTSRNAGLYISPGLQNFAGGWDAFIAEFSPTGILRWATYFGGSSNESGTGIIVDGNNNVFFTGSTGSNNLPVTAGGGALLGSTDAYVVGLNGIDGIKRWARYLGGEAFEIGRGITADKNNNIIVCGNTSSSGFPIAGCLPASSYKGGTSSAGDAFVTRFDNTGLILWSTYLGGTNEEIATGVTTDTNDNVLVTGYTQSDAAFTPPLTPARNNYDVFLVEYDANCGFIWGRRYGGTAVATEIGYDVAVDLVTNEIVVTGTTSDIGFPTTGGALRNYRNGSTSTIINKFNSVGAPLWSTYFGGEVARGVEIDASGGIWLTGYSNGDIPTTPTALQPNYVGNNDAFVAYITANGQNILCATYYGGSGNDQGNGIALDNMGNVYICGTTSSPSLPHVGAGSFQPNLNGPSDAFIATICTNCGLPQDTAYIVDKDTVDYPNDTVFICAGDTAHLMNLFDFTTTLGYKSVNYHGNQATFRWYNVTKSLNIPGDLRVKDIATDGSWIKVSMSDTCTYRLISWAVDCRIDTSYITVAAIPAPDITYPDKQDSICPADTATHNFTVNLTGVAPWTLEIKKPNGTTFNHPCPGTPCNIASTNPGIYVVQKITDNQCFKKLQDTLKLDFFTEPTATISGGKKICPGDSVQLKVSHTGTSPWNYKVKLGGSYVQHTNVISDTSFWVKQAGTYFIDLVWDKNCYKKIYTSTTVDFHTRPFARITNPEDKDTLLICPYNNATITIAYSGGASPYKLYYHPSVAGSPPPTGSTTIVVNTPGWYVLDSIVDANGCDSILKDSIYIGHHTLPTASFTVNKDTICKGDSVLYTLNLTGSSPFEVTASSNLGTPIPPLKTPNPWSKYLKPGDTDTFIITKIKDQYCEQTLTLDTTIVVKTKPVVNSVTTNCNGASTEYTVSITMSSDNPPLTPGIWSSGGGNTYTFTSTPIPSCSPYIFDFDDDNHCGPVNVSGTRCCNCVTRAGTVNTTPQTLCLSQNTSNPHNNDSVLDNTDTLEFILHDGGGTLIDRNNNGLFSFDAAKGMSCGTTYYVSVVAGNKQTAYPSRVDSADGCFNSTANVPVTWLCNPTLSETHTDSICPGDSSKVVLTLSGSKSPFDVEIDGGRITYPSISSGYTFYVPATADTSFLFTSVRYTTAPGCTESITNTVNIRTFTKPVIQNINYTCDNTLTNYQVSFTISGGNPDSYMVTPAGTIIGSNYTSNWINSCGPYNFTVTDKNNCQPPANISGNYCCTCKSNAGTPSTTDTISVCGTQPVQYPHNGNQVFDGNDTLIFYLHEGSLSGGGRILTHNGSGKFFYNVPPPMFYDAVYYITPVAGNKLTDSVNFADPCLSIGTAVPVVFRELPGLISLSAQPNDSVCPGTSVNLLITGKGHLPLTYTRNIAPFNYPCSTHTDLMPLGVMNNDLTVTISQIKDPYCQAAVNQSITIKVSPPFSATVSTNQIACKDSTGKISMNVNGGFGTPDYKWYNNSNVLVAQGSSELVTSFPGIYKLSVEDDIGCKAAFQDTLVAPPLFDIDFIKILGETCFALKDGSLKVHAPDGKTYDIKRGNPTVVDWLSQTTTDTARFVRLDYTPGSDSIRISVTSSNNCYADSVIHFMGLYPITLNVPDDDTICPGDCVQLMAQASGGNGNFCYLWDSNPCTSDSTFVVCPNQTTTYIIQARDSNSCPSAIDSITITVPPALTQVVSVDDTVCYGTAVTLFALPTGGIGTPSYRWADMNGDLPETTRFLSFMATASNIYTITSSDTCGSSVTDVISVTVESPAVVNIDSVPIPNHCAPFKMVFTNQSTGNYDSCRWTINGVVQPGADCQKLDALFADGGNYTVGLTLINSQAGCNYPLTPPLYVTAFNRATADFTFEPDPVTLLDPNISTHNYSKNGPLSTWLLDDSLISNKREVEIHFETEEERSYNLCLVADNLGGCMDTLCKTIVVTDEMTLFIPNSFSPNGDGYNDYFFAKGAGFDENYFKLTIYNRWGAPVFSTNSINGKWDGTFEGNPAQSDLYLWSLDIRAKKTTNKIKKTGTVFLIR